MKTTLAKCKIDYFEWIFSTIAMGPWAVDKYLCNIVSFYEDEVNWSQCMK